ncbi:MAG TPA: type II secretion system secretin GspD [Acetobacteraceae bacterium]|jgi:general secretion pathway protein D|nr:type II secretion system secretin GspD [Acetobacteraceae bacterium]
MTVRARTILLGSVLALAACEKAAEPVLGPLPPLPPGAEAVGKAAARVNGRIGAVNAPLPVETSVRAPAPVQVSQAGATEAGGDISLDFVETDIREVASQVLGGILHVNFSIDPAVRGVVTLRTARPIGPSQVLATLQSVLAQSGVSVVRSGNLYRVIPTPARANTFALGGSGSEATAGSTVVPLRYASAEDLVKVLTPFVLTGARIAAEPTRNAIIIDGEPAARQALTELIAAFDTDLLSGQSYALMPVGAGNLKDFASAMQEALRSQTGGALAGVVRVVPMERVNAVLVVSSQPRYIEEARRVYALVERARSQTVRSWRVIYLQNSHTNDIAYVLQRAFTPNDVSATPTSGGSGGQSALGQGSQFGFGGGGGGGGLGGFGFGGSGGGQLGGFGQNSGGVGGLGGGSLGGTPTGGIAGTAGGLNVVAPPTRQSSNPLLGPLTPGGGSGGEVTPDAMRIIPNVQNNAILVYATARENEVIDAMIRKIDILPLQVRIDAVIAEVTLNDNLKYGTQFFFKSGGVNGILSSAVEDLSTVNLSSAVLGTTLPGFVIGGSGRSGAPFVISALQSVTNVQVLSSPELLVLDNQPARLQVGNVVPYLSQTSQSTLTSNAPIVNSINYQQTGVIMSVTPRVNAGGLVTLDISQEVSDVAAAVTTTGLNSPTFLQRSVSSRVVVQDGQTIGLAGLIRDSVTQDNGGIPWLKDVPLLGLLAGQQDNARQRTELIILITPHVVHDQREARALTADLREQLVNAAALPASMRALRPSGSADPSERMRQRIQH